MQGDEAGSVDGSGSGRSDDGFNDDEVEDGSQWNEGSGSGNGESKFTFTYIHHRRYNPWNVLAAYMKRSTSTRWQFSLRMISRIPEWLIARIPSGTNRVSIVTGYGYQLTPILGQVLL